MKQAPHRNVTLSLPETLLRRFRIYAAEHNTSMTSLMVEAIRRTIDREESREEAKRRLIERMKSAPDRGTRGRISWTRSELYERDILK